MSNELQIVDESTISVEVKAEINEDIDRIISAHKNNRQAINKLVFESVAAMTEADDAQAELSSKSWLQRMIGGITGSNSRLQNRINSGRATAMYASQQTLQKLAEQNLMTFDLIAAVNNKLNASLLKVDDEFANVYQVLGKFFKSNRSELARIEVRLEKVERNVNLLNWQNSIEYQEFEGIEYTELDDVSKIVCLVRDFYDITKGEWSNSDLLLLKAAMNTIEITPKTKVNYFEVLKGISYNEKLKNHMLNEKTIKQIDEPGYLLSLGCLKKFEVLNAEEDYIVDTIVNYMDNNGIPKEREVVCSDLTSRYLANKAYVNVDIDVECYDLILDLLYNIRQAKEEKLLVDDISIGNNNNIEEAIVVESEDVKAKDLYEQGWNYQYGIGVERDFYSAYDCYKKAADMGNVDALVGLGWMYEYGHCVERDEKKAFSFYMSGAELGSPRGINNLAGCYEGGIVVSIDNSKAIELYKKAAELGFVPAIRNVARYFESGIGFTVQNYEKAMDFYTKAAELGDAFSMNKIGLFYELGKGVNKSFPKALEWYQKAAELGNIDAKNNIKGLKDKGYI